jgi:nitrogen fixation NifU-like protein
MANNRALYEQVILEHNKKPRNFHPMEDADRSVEGMNPLCGDHFTIFLKFDGDTISDVSFDGSGCAISKSSASIMTMMLKGKTKKEAEALFEKLHHLLMSSTDAEVDTKELGRLAALAGVREFPVRIKCATLAWHAMVQGIRGEDDAVSTE